MILALASTSCGFAHSARQQYVVDHAGCAPDVVRERPELEPPGDSTRAAFEMIGCNTHELYTCGGWSGRHTEHFSCTSQPWCDSPGCAEDYAGVAKSLFVTDASCPRERVSAVFTSAALPPPPPEVAGDAAREKLWRDKQRALLDEATASGQVLVTASGCGHVALYACTKRAPSAPMCGARIGGLDLLPTQ